MHAGADVSVNVDVGMSMDAGVGMGMGMWVCVCVCVCVHTSEEVDEVDPLRCRLRIAFSRLRGRVFVWYVYQCAGVRMCWRARAQMST